MSPTSSAAEQTKTHTAAADASPEHWVPASPLTLQVATMATLGVRSGSLTFAEKIRAALSYAV
jgi:hypothetical protein